MALPRFITSAVGAATRTLGRTYDYVTPGGGTSQLTKVGRAISDPNQIYKGGLTPSGLVRSITSPTSQFQTIGSPSGGAGGSAPQVKPAGVDVPEGGYYEGGDGGAGEKYDPNTDPVRIAGARGDIKELMGLFDNAFEDAMAKVDALAAEKKKEFMEKYTQAKESLTRNYGDTAGQIDNQFSARNAFNSSYRAGEQGTAKDAFEDAYGGLNKSQSQDLASVGQFAAQQEAELKAGRPSYDLGDYTELDDLLTIKQNVDQAIKALSTTSAGLGTTSQYRQNLNKIVPANADKGNSALKAQLDRLAGTNANPEAKRFIAQQTINDAGEDENAWLDYFDKALRDTGSEVQPDQALAVQ